MSKQKVILIGSGVSAKDLALSAWQKGYAPILVENEKDIPEEHSNLPVFYLEPVKSPPPHKK